MVHPDQGRLWMARIFDWLLVTFSDLYFN